MAEQPTTTRATETRASGTRAVFDQNLVAALSHPLRVRILDVLIERVASPRDIAEELGAKVGDVTYHVTKLRELGAIELVRTEPRRGTIKHFYRAAMRTFIDDDHMKHVPVAVRRELFGSVLGDIWSRVTDAAEHGGFERADAHVSAIPLDLDDQGYQEVVDLLTATLERMMAIQSEVISRRAEGESPEDGLRSEVAMMHYLRPPAGARNGAGQNGAQEASS
jgi:DNA-binding transcriptional ArsR family regulator